MDQIKIGRFIAERRRLQGLTQAQLAEKLNITDRAVSKWETGRSLPDATLMLALCEILGISVNELLSGEKVTMENNQEKNEQNKTIWSAMWIIMIVSILALFAGLFAAAFFVPEGPWQLVVILAVVVVFLIPCFYALKLEVSVGAYKCKNCGYEIVPTYKEALGAMHRGTTRYLKCPKCNKRTWCKKVIRRD